MGAREESKVTGPIRSTERIEVLDLLQSLVCILVFDGWALGNWGRWTMAEQAILVLALWGLQLLVSPWWHRRHSFGPAEWLLRCATYAQRPGKKPRTA